MRFACDRCKTRYSIADERVRGKILKIRCKACANVITVKEGMEVPPEVERVHRPTTLAPQSTVGSGGVAAPPAPALGSAFASAMNAPAPSQLEDEWYVSRDGEQQGPFSLPSAQAWVASQPYDAELYCWCEGFDDWLPVDRIGHFRNLRPRPQPPVAPPTAVSAASSPPLAKVKPSDSDEEPGRARPGARVVSAPVATVIDAAPPPAREPAARMVSAPVATVIDPMPSRAREPGGRMGGPVATVIDGSLPGARDQRPASGPVATMVGAAPSAVRGPQPAAAAGRGDSGLLARSAPTGSAAPTRDAELSSAASSGGFSLEERPAFAASIASLASPSPAAALPSAAQAPWPGAPLGTNGAGGAAGPSFGATGAPAPAVPAADPALGLAAPRGAFDAGDLGNEGFSADASASGLRPSAGVSSFDDDELEFGEVSRVVRIADLNKSAPRPQVRGPQAVGRRTAANEVLPQASAWSASSPGQGAALGLGAADGGAGGAPAELGRAEVPVVIPASQRRNHALLLALVAIGLIGAGVTALVLLRGSSPEDPLLISTSDRDVRDLTIRPDDPRRVTTGTAGSPEHQPTRPTAPVVKRPGGAVVATGTTPGTGQGPGGKIEAAPSAGPLTPLGGEEVEEMSQRNSSGLQRCYEQALKKDIFLDVKSIKVTISIDAAGMVQSVGMSSHADHVLGQCMVARIRNWRFRANSRGLDAKFTVAFGRSS